MKTIFYDVDTQKDFINPDGALYVKGAEKLKPNLAALASYAQKAGVRIVASVDAHNEKSAELLANGGPFPHHCMKGTAGQEKIPETWLNGVPRIPTVPVEGLDGIVKGANALMIEKDSYDVSTNPNFAGLIRATAAERAVVYGVAVEYCVKAAALALRKLGLETFVVIDAVEGIGLKGQRDAFMEMKDAGVKYAWTREVLRGAI